MVTRITFLFSTTYLFLFFLFFNLSRPFLFWCLIELSVLLFILICYRGNKSYRELGASRLFYFVIQLYSSILLIYSFCSRYLRDVGYLKDVLIVISISLKISIFPFQFWRIKFRNVLNWETFWLFITLQKIPVLFFLFQVTNNIINFRLWLCLISGTIIILFSQTLNDLIISSSLYSIFWLNFIFDYSVRYFFYFNIYYFSCLYFILYPSKNVGEPALWGSIFLLGLPPLSLFFFKFDVLIFALFKLSISEFLLVWLFTFFSVFGYLKHFFNLFFFKISLYLKNENFTKIISFFYLRVCYSLFFFLYLK